ncbi:MAG: DUF5317 domain-containing protein [Chloroflexota bacterium]|nr:DUF5317 domain-containing protein [Chloroflexota bacterium]
MAIGAARIRLLWLTPIALGAQLILTRTIGSDIPWWVWPVHAGSYALLVIMVAGNRQIPGIPVIAVGLLMNATVILANGGLMPQGPETVQLRHAGEVIALGQHIPRTKGVLLPRDATRLWWLSDHIVLPSGRGLPMVVSPGDLLLAVGLAVTVQGLMQRRTDATAEAIYPWSGTLKSSGFAQPEAVKGEAR